MPKIERLQAARRTGVEEGGSTTEGVGSRFALSAHALGDGCHSAHGNTKLISHDLISVVNLQRRLDGAPDGGRHVFGAITAA